MSRFRFDGLQPLWSEWQTVFDDETEQALNLLVSDIVAELALPFWPARADKGPRLGVDARGKEDAVLELISVSRWRYLHFYFDWLSRVMPDSGAWRVQKDEWLAAGSNLPAGVALEGWGNLFGKGRGNPGFFNTIHDEHYPPLGSPPLIDLYMTVFRWWDENIGGPFRPNFVKTGLASSRSREALDDLNPAARLLLRVVRAVDERYTEAHCASVHTEYARRQRKE